MTYPSIKVADRIIQIANDCGEQLNSVTKLLKLVYIAHGIHLAKTGSPLIDDRVEAWKYGPVVRSVYLKFHSQMRHVLKPISEEDAKQELDNTSEEIVQEVCRKYKNTDYSKLSILTHRTGTPWDKVTDDPNFRFYSVISNEIIKEYYKKSLHPGTT